MQIGNTTQTYGFGSQKLHWLTAILIFGLLAVGWIMSDMDNSPDKFQLYGLHKATGAVVLFLTFARIGWTLSQPKPEMLGAENRLQYIAAKAVHGLLYLWLIAMPLSGWVMSNAAGYPVKVYGLFTLPNIVEKSKAIGGIAHEAHEILPLIGVALIAVHVGAAIYHHVMLKDDTLRRMIPGYKLPMNKEG